MTPSHSDGLAAGRRIKASLDGGDRFASAEDAITLHTYMLSLELRRLPRGERAARTRAIAKQLIRNTGESL